MSDTDSFYRSKVTQRAIAWLVVSIASSLAAGFVWNLAKTAELEGEMKAGKQRVDSVVDDIKEIKADVKRLLERKP